jgi:hypothetical protein
MREDTTRPGPRNLPDTLTRLRLRVRELLYAAGREAFTRSVWLTPGLSVGDVLAHLVGTAADAARGEVLSYPAIAAEEAVRGHLASHGGRPPEELFGIWETAEKEFDGVLDEARLTTLIVEMTAREHDLRTVLDQPAARDDVAVLVSLDALSGTFSDRAEAADAPPLRVTVEQWGTIIGAGAAHDCLVGDRFEFVRAMTGRRSRAQVSRWSWSREPHAYYDLLSATGSLAPADVRERDPRVPEHLRDFDLTH